MPAVHLMGGTYLVHHGRRIDLPDGGGRLIAFVLLHGGSVRRRQVAGALWPDSDEARAARNLRSALWRLRSAGIDVLRPDAHRLRACPDAVVDVDELARWSSRLIVGRPHPADLDEPPTPLLGAELLPGLDDDWVCLERERIRQRVLHGVEALARHLAADLRHVEAIEVARSLVRAEPGRTSAHLLLAEVQRAGSAS